MRQAVRTGTRLPHPTSLIVIGDAATGQGPCPRPGKQPGPVTGDFGPSPGSCRGTYRVMGETASRSREATMRGHEMMSRQVVTARPSMTVTEASVLLLDHGVRTLPVVV